MRSNRNSEVLLLVILCFLLALVIGNLLLPHLRFRKQSRAEPPTIERIVSSEPRILSYTLFPPLSATRYSLPGC